MRPFNCLVDVFLLHAGFDSAKLPGKVSETRVKSGIDSIPNNHSASFTRYVA
jgi:hypothetical protein